MNSFNQEEQETDHHYNTRTRAKRIISRIENRNHRTLSEDRGEFETESSAGKPAGRFWKGLSSEDNSEAPPVTKGSKSRSENELNKHKHVIFAENKHDAKQVLEELGKSLKQTFGRSNTKSGGKGIKSILKNSLPLSSLETSENTDNLGVETGQSIPATYSVTTVSNTWIPIRSSSQRKHSDDEYPPTFVDTTNNSADFRLSTLETSLKSGLKNNTFSNDITKEHYSPNHKVVCQALVPYNKSLTWQSLSEGIASLESPVRLIDIAGVINAPTKSNLPTVGYRRQLPSPPPITVPTEEQGTGSPELHGNIQSLPNITSLVKTNQSNSILNTKSTSPLTNSKTSTLLRPIPINSYHITSIEVSQAQVFVTIPDQNTLGRDTPHIPGPRISEIQTDNHPIKTCSIPATRCSSFFDFNTLNPQVPQTVSAQLTSLNSPGSSRHPGINELSPAEEIFSDSEEDIEMAYTTPNTFRGTSQENAVGWLRHAKWWLDTTRAGSSPDLRRRLHQLAVLFQDEAENWFANLRIGTATSDERMASGEGNSSTAIQGVTTQLIASWEDFERAFLQRFKRDESGRTGDITALIQMKQTPGQTVEEFVTAIRKQGTLVNATQQEMYMAVVTGMNQLIKAQIMQFDPPTLDEIVKRGKIAERYPIYSASNNTSSTAGRSNSRDKLDQLISAVNELSVSASPPSPRQSHPNNPVRVRFSSAEPRDERDESSTRRSRSQTPTRGELDPRYDRNSSRERSGSPSPRRQGYQDERRDSNSQQRDRPQFVDGRPGNFSMQRPYREAENRFVRGQGRPMGGANWQSDRCGRCGRSHGEGGRCPAINTSCANCGRRGHWRVCCRGGRGGGNSMGQYAGRRPPLPQGGFQ